MQEGNRDYARRKKISEKIIFNVLSVIRENAATLKQEQENQYTSAAKRILGLVANGNPKVTAVH